MRRDDGRRALITHEHTVPQRTVASEQRPGGDGAARRADQTHLRMRRCRAPAVPLAVRCRMVAAPGTPAARYGCSVMALSAAASRRPAGAPFAKARGRRANRHVNLRLRRWRGRARAPPPPPAAAAARARGQPLWPRAAQAFDEGGSPPAAANHPCPRRACRWRAAGIASSAAAVATAVRRGPRRRPEPLRIRPSTLKRPRGWRRRLRMRPGARRN